MKTIRVFVFPELIGPILLFCIALFPAPATAASVRSGWGSNICVEVPQGGGARSQLQITACSASLAQQFTLADGQIRSGLFCLDAWSGMGRDGDATNLWYCQNLANQRWTRTAAGEIRGIAGKCLTASGAAAGTKLQLWTCNGSAGQQWTVLDSYPGSSTADSDKCTVRQFQPSESDGIRIWSSDKSRYLMNKDDADGISQVYVGRAGNPAPTCITCSDKPNGPGAKKRKMQAHWHPSGRWIVLAAELENFTKPFYATSGMIEGWLESGMWVNMYATNPDGTQWYKLQEFGGTNRANGFTGVAFTPDGRKGVWAQIVDGNVLSYSFGRWELIMGEFTEVNGVPAFTKLRDITPPDTYWLEPGNFSPNGKDLLLSADQNFPDHAKVFGQDQYILDVNTGMMTNLTKSPDVWDEHGVFSPDGEKILFMSAHPYRSEPLTSTTIFLKTEFMIMDKDGSNLRQISHFNVPGYPEYSFSGSVASVGGWSSDGKTVSAQNLFFPKYKTWDIQFEGACGNPQ